MAPVSWNGANTLYHRVIKPFVLKHQTQIDKALDKVGQKVDEVAKEGILTFTFERKLAKKVYHLPFILYLHSFVAVYNFIPQSTEICIN